MKDQFPRFDEIDHLLLRCYEGEVPREFLKQNGFGDSAYTTWYVISGSAKLNSVGKDLSIQSGDWVFFDPFLARSMNIQSGTRLLSIAVQIRWRDVLFFEPVRELEIVRNQTLGKLHNAGKALARLYDKMQGKEPDLAMACRLEASFMDWLAEWHRVRSNLVSGKSRHSVSDPRVQQVVAHLAKQPGLGVIDYQALETITHLSRSQLDRLFKKHFLMTPRRWAERQTLATAEHMLHRGNYSIKEIAAQLQFTDSSHFAKWFKRQTGTTPGKLRIG